MPRFFSLRTLVSVNPSSITPNRRLRLRLHRFISVFLIVVLASTSAPAAPRLFVDVWQETSTDLFFLLNRSELLTLLQGRGREVRQEKQEERDEKIARIEIYPNSASLDLSDKVHFSAAAFDSNGEQLIGAKIKWRAEESSEHHPAKITRTGEFEAVTPGSFIVTAEAKGQSAQATITVRRGTPRDTKKPPLSSKPVSSHDLPNPAENQESTPGAEGQVAANAKRNAKTRRAHAPAPYMPSGTGWDNTNYWSADDSGNLRGAPNGTTLTAGAGNGNFQINAPVLSLPGRGIDVTLSLVYNSKVWNKAGSQIAWDNDLDWPATGWSLGFSRMLSMGTNGGCMIVESDGTRHSYAGTISNYPWGQYFSGYTTDGSLIDYTCATNTNGVVTSANASLPTGSRVEYYAYSLGQGMAYPTRITDVDGNYISMSYTASQGRIQTLVDTLGRVINFHYGPNNLLAAITAPGLGGGTRTVVRIHYKQITLSHGWSGLTPRVPTPFPWVIDAIYYPGTNTGYWFGDSDSYSSYGMIAKVVEARGMSFSASSLNDMGTVTAPAPSQITRKEVYNYPMTPNYSLTDAPTYTTCVETWTRDGVNTDSATTTYALNMQANPRTVTVTLPNGTQNIQYSYNAPGQYNDGLVYLDETKNAAGAVIQSSSTSWEQGYNSTPRPYRVQSTNEKGQTSKQEFSYTGYYNQVTEQRDYDYGGNLLRSTRTSYENSWDYMNVRHIFNLPLSVEVFNASNVRVGKVDYQYDGQTLSPTSGAWMHDPSYDPYNTDEICCDCCNWQWDYYTDSWVCTEYCPGVPIFNPSTNYRGRVTQITNYANASTEPAMGPVIETRRYDVTGNLVKIGTACCEQTTYEYNINTQFAYPLSATRGSATDPYSQINTSVTIDVNTGLATSTTDANGRQSLNSFDPASLRPSTATSSTGGHTHHTYDDVALTVTKTAYAVAHTAGETAIAEQNIKLLDGRSKIRQEKALTKNAQGQDAWDAVDIVYDSMGRVSQQSGPYRVGVDSPQWTTTVYDALSRPTRVTSPDGSVTETYYNEVDFDPGDSYVPVRPNVVNANTPGETTLVRDAWGRERWGRTDVDDKLVEAVEPNPDGNGSTASNGLVTTYAYDTLGNLTTITQGSQTRAFKYDHLGRMVAQKLAELSATLNDAGTYVGSGTWSNVLTYDDRSNIATSTDARGVKTVYTYNNDPLGRLQSVSWDTSGFGDTSYPILSAPTLTYQYRTKSSGSELKDVRQVASITTAGVSTESLTYDTEGRIVTKTVTLNSRPSYPFVTDYIFDLLDRVTDVRYPAEYGNGSQPRKLIHYNYDVASRLSSLTVDGQNHASSLVYNPANQATSIAIGLSGGNQITENYTYNSQTGLLDNQTVVRGGSTTLLNLSYGYTNAANKRTGQLASISNNLDHSKDRVFQYDALGRVKRATGGQSVNWAQRYYYDRYGNRTWAFSHTAEQYVRNFYQKALDRQPNSTELNSWLSTLQTAYAQGTSQYWTAMQNLGAAVFTSQEYANRNRNDHWYVYDLYQAYLWRDPDPGGWAHWEANTAAVGRNATRAGFDWSTEFETHVGGTSPYSPAGGATVPGDGWASLHYDNATNRINDPGWYYDAAGNQTRVQNGATWHRYQYDAAGRLAKVKADDNVTVISSYTYGTSNQRLIREEAGVRTYYVAAGNSEMCEYTETGAATNPLWSKSYIYLGNRLLSSLTPNGAGGEAVTYHHPDRLGTRLVSNGQNTTSFEQATLPFGTALNVESTGATNRRFTTYDRSSTTGLDYAVNRHYDSQQGRFTQVDPIGIQAASLGDPQSLNMYTYCGNDPVNRVDPDGLFWGKLWRAIKKIISSKWFQIALAIAFIVIAHYYPHSLFGWLGGGSTKAAGATAPTLQTATATAAQKAAEAAFWEAAFVQGGAAALEGAVITAGAASAAQLGIVAAQIAVAAGKAAMTEEQAKMHEDAKEKAKKAVKSERCRAFLASKGIDADKVLAAIDKQRGFNGLKSTLTLHQAGIVKKLTDKFARDTIADYFSFRKVFAAVGTYRLKTRYDVYFNDPQIIDNPALTVIHEALHSVTRMSDFDLAFKIGAITKDGDPMTWLQAGPRISPHLKANGCNP